MTLLTTLKQRYTTKSYDKQKTVSSETVHELLESLRYAPSSLNLQPWHFFIAHDEKSRQRIAQSTSGPYGFNHGRVTDASHVIALCTRKTLTPDYLETLADCEAKAGRLKTPQDREKVMAARKSFLSLHKSEHDVTAWLAKQVYLAAGFLLLSAGLLKVDATPIEGFDPEILSDVLNLKEQNLVPSLLISLGYHASDDRNKNAPKARLGDKTIFTWL